MVTESGEFDPKNFVKPSITGFKPATPKTFGKLSATMPLTWYTFIATSFLFFGIGPAKVCIRYFFTVSLHRNTKKYKTVLYNKYKYLTKSVINPKSEISYRVSVWVIFDYKNSIIYCKTSVC